MNNAKTKKQMHNAKNKRIHQTLEIGKAQETHQNLSIQVFSLENIYKRLEIKH